MSAGGIQSSIFRPYLKLFDPDTKVTGIISADLDYTYHKKTTITGSLNYNALKLTMPRFRLDAVNSQSGSGELDMSWGPEKQSIALNNSKLKMNGFEVTGSFGLKGPPKDRSINLRISSTPGDYKEIKELVPYKLFSKKVKEKIEAFEVKSGKIRINELKINVPIKELKGTALLRDSESFTMELEFEGIDFKYPNFNDTFSNIWGALSFRGQVIKLENLNGLYGKAKIEKLDGVIAELANKVTYKINIFSSLDLSESLPELKRLTRGSLDKISGSGPITLDLHLYGGGGEPFNYSGKVDFLDTTLNHSSIPIERFTSTNGTVGFEKELVVINDLHAMSGGSKLTLNGTIENLKSPSPDYNLSLKGALESVGLNSLLKSRGLKPIHYKYLLYYDCKVTGKKDNMDIKSTLDLTDIEMTYKNVLKKKRGFPVLVKVEGRVHKKEADINKAIFNIGTSHISMTGKLNLEGKAYDLDIPRTRLKVKDIDSVLTMLKDDEWSSGILELALKTKKKRGTRKTLLNGEASLTNAFFSPKLLKNQLEEVNLKILFKGNEADITIDSATIGKSSATGRVTLTDIQKRVMDFDIHSSYLNTIDLALNDDRARAEKKKKKSAITGTGKILIKKGHFNKQPFKAFKTKVLMDKDHFHIDPIIFSMSEGIITGKVSYIKDPEAERLYNATLEIRSLKLETLIKELGSKKKVISGKLNSDLSLFGKRGLKMKEGLGGKISIASTRGRMWKFPVITKIFSLVNIISISNLFESGLEYKMISGNFSIKDGLFYTDDLLFDSSSLRMSLVGRANYPKDTINATLGFHPFVTVDKIINLIPLAGWLISGKDKSAITMYYEIKGPLKDPNVQAVPIKSLGKGIFGILERAMKLPGQVLTPAPKKEKDNGNENEKDGEEPKD
jgi:uncharacterized protein YhdP